MYLLKTQYIKLVEVDTQQEKNALKLFRLFEIKTKEYSVY